MERHPNYVLARRLWTAIADADRAGLRELISEKTRWHMPGESPLAGTYVGFDAILQFMARVGELTDDLQSELQEIFVSDRGALLRYHLRAVRGAQHLDTEQLFLIHTKAGRITHGAFVPTDQRAYDRFFTPQ